MKKILIICLTVLFCFAVQTAFAQIPIRVLIQISKAEDELRYDKNLEDLMMNPNEKIRQRTALAAGRIGNEKAIPMLTNLLLNDTNEIRSTAAFALGEIESVKAADAILKVLKNTKNAETIRARAVEAAGKIAAANAKDAKAKNLGEAILDALQFEDSRGAKQNRAVVLLGITAVLRGKPKAGDFMTAKFLTNMDARIRADAANTLSRLRSKIADEKLRAMLLSDNDPIARANAARALGAAEDKDAFNLLLESAASDKDSRVRVSAIRSLGSLKDSKAADRLLTRGENLYQKISAKVKPTNEATPNVKQYAPFYPLEQNELLEIFTTLGRILVNTNNQRVIKLLHNFMSLDGLQSPEAAIAASRISPNFFDEQKIYFSSPSAWRTQVTLKSGMAEAATFEKSPENDKLQVKFSSAIRRLIQGYENSKEDLTKAIPDSLRAFAAFKTNDLPEILRGQLKTKDIFVRAIAAELLGEQPANKENVEALKTAFAKSLETDKQYNDAQLAILSALVKSDKKEAIDSLKLALDAPNFLVRRHAAQLIKQNDLQTSFPNADEKVGTVKPYNPKTGTKLGQVLNTNADYLRAVSRKNARAILTTEKGTFTIEFFPEDAPLTVDNFIRLARKNYFNGLAIHRVVPNFVMQDGDPRGDGNGGPGWQIRDEINMLPFERGAVGMALSGKDTGGSQWFVTHSPQPHLDGGYTVFGKVNETGMKIVDNLVRGDKILTVKIVERNSPQNSQRTRRKTK